MDGQQTRLAKRQRSAIAGLGCALVFVFGGALACSSEDGTAPDAGSSSGGASSSAATTATSMPAYERLDCDLPSVIEYCGGASCHYDKAAPELASSLLLWDRANQQILEGVEARLVNVPANYHNVANPDTCPSEPELLVDTSDVEQSLVLKKLLGTHTCGDEMPKFPYPEWGATNNPGAQREEFVSCIRSWVTLLVQDYNEAP